MKRCGKCRKIKEVCDFYKSKATKDGLHSWCKSCKKEREKFEASKEYKQFKKLKKEHKKLLKEQNLKKCPLCKQEKLLTEFNKHKNRKDGLTQYCRNCDNQITRQYKENNPNYQKQWYENNHDYALEYASDYYFNNIEYHRRNNARWRNDNPNYVKNYMKQWLENNPDKIAKYHIERRLRTIQQTPIWYEENLVKQIYLLRDKRNLSENRQELVHTLVVDHVIPINPRDDSVCGLHCKDNLHIITWSQNSSKQDKYNRHWLDKDGNMIFECKN